MVYELRLMITPLVSLIFSSETRITFHTPGCT